jgi:hypothetical protein
MILASLDIVHFNTILVYIIFLTLGVIIISTCTIIVLSYDQKRLSVVWKLSVYLLLFLAIVALAALGIIPIKISIYDIILPLVIGMGIAIISLLLILGGFPLYQWIRLFIIRYRIDRQLTPTNNLTENTVFAPSQPFHSSSEISHDSFLFAPSANRPSAIQNTSSIRILVLEEPLTAQNLATIITALTELYTKCWLIAKGRFADLSTYTLTHSARFAEEANLIINDIIHNSPFSFDLSLNPESVAKAVQIAIDSVSLAGVRKQEAELEIKAKELETKLKEQEAKAAQKDKEQARQLEAQKAELERQRDLLEIEKQQLEIEKQRFELQANRISYAIKTAGEMVDLLNPGMDAATKAMNVQLLIPNLLQLANGKGLELGLPAPQVDAS